MAEKYMSIGELASKMGVSVRTLQYYDKEGLLSPPLKNESGRRFYTNKDMVKLHQIISLKSIDFSLKQIKRELSSLGSHKEFAEILLKQEKAMEEKLENLKKSYNTVKLLRQEVLMIDKVDFEMYADIIINLQMGNDFYWLIKHFDNEMLDYLRSKFDSKTGMKFIEDYNAISEKVHDFYEEDADPACDEVQEITKVFWGLVMEFTGGDMNMMKKLEEFSEFITFNKGDEYEWAQKQQKVNEYLEKSLRIYFASLNDRNEGE